MKRINALRQKGFAHHVVPILVFVLLFGVIGAYFYVRSHAAVLSTAITSGYQGFCLNDPGDSNAAGVTVQIASCNRSDTQSWQTGFGYGQVEIHGLCLGTANNSQNSGQPIVTIACNKNGQLQSSARWKSTSGRLSQLINLNSGKCLSVGAAVNGASAKLEPCNGSKGQLWNVIWGGLVDKSLSGNTPAYCAGGGSQLWSNLESCGWPGPANTGPVLAQCPGGSLTNVGSGSGQVIKITTDNTTVSCENITGMLEIAAKNVTVTNVNVIALPKQNTSFLLACS